MKVPEKHYPPPLCRGRIVEKDAINTKFVLSGQWASPRIFKPILHKFNGQSSSRIGIGMRCNTKGSTPTWSCILFWFALACVQITGSTTASAQEHQYLEPEDTLSLLEPTELAITVDDLPAHSSAHPGMTRLEIAADMIAALQAGGSPPAYGFTNGTPLEWDPAVRDVLRMWHDAGYLLANHTYSHLDLAQVSAETFIGDIERMDRALTPWASASSEKLFRYPYLSEGDTRAKRRIVRQYLKQAGYRIAPVTVDYNDWAWSAAYTRCSLAHDDAAMRRLQDDVVTVARLKLLKAQQQSKSLVGRDIKHILLIHISAFTARTLRAILAAFQADGVKLISLPAALEDPVYRIDPNQLGQRDMTFLMQLNMLHKAEEGSSRNASGPIQFDPAHNICQG
jgi:peptidoglycan/xylan/chitin deacetylase (PgdA/CDA1 family)